MKPAERTEHRNKMTNFKTYDECKAYQDEHQLGALRWHVLYFMRRYFAERQIAPDARFVVKQTCNIAGMRRPRAWSTA